MGDAPKNRRCTWDGMSFFLLCAPVVFQSPIVLSLPALSGEANERNGEVGACD